MQNSFKHLGKSSALVEMCFSSHFFRFCVLVFILLSVILISISCIFLQFRISILLCQSFLFYSFLSSMRVVFFGFPQVSLLQWVAMNAIYVDFCRYKLNN